GERRRTTANLALTNVCVQPALGSYTTTNVQKLPAILDAGEAAAEAALPAIRRTLDCGTCDVMEGSSTGQGGTHGRLGRIRFETCSPCRPRDGAARRDRRGDIDRTCCRRRPLRRDRQGADHLDWLR